MNKEKGIRLVILVAAVAMLLLGLNMRTNRQKTILNKGEKTIQVQIVFEDGSFKAYALETTQDTLGEALKDAQLIQGEESAYGMFIKSVGGVEADVSKEQWWCLMKNGEEMSVGVDSAIIEDGDTYLLVLRTGW